MNYSYPLDETWTTQEMTVVVHFYTLIEKAYEQKVPRREILDAYNIFKKIVPSKSEEKKLLDAFQKASGYSGYHTVQKAKTSTDNTISM